MKRYLVFVALLMALPSFALQIKTAADNEPIKASISTQELTRIFVEDDKISSVVGISSLYLVQNDDQGAIFIKPTAAAQKEKNLNLFIATQSGHNYILRLVPVKSQAETIMLKPKFVLKKSPYQNLLCLITTMVNRSAGEYSVTNVVSKKPQYTLGKAKMFLVSVYQNEELRGEIYQLINTGNRAITLNEKQFYRDGVRVVTLQDHTVLPDGKTFIYLGIQNL